MAISIDGTNGLTTDNAALKLDGTTLFVDDTNNNVGIGTTSPTFAAGGGLQVQTNSFSCVRVTETGNTGVDFAQSSGGDGYVYVRDDADIIFGTNNTEQMRLDNSGNLRFNSGYGSVATAYGCRAWVNFNGTGTVAIRASGNVSSITDSGTGDYKANFTTAMPDKNYAVGGLFQPTVTNVGSDTFANFSASATTQVRVAHYEDGTLRDSGWVSLIVFR